MEQIAALLTHAELCESACIPVADIPFSQEVIKACEQNVCGKYNSCWTCPPARGSLETMRAEMLAFSHAHVLTYCAKLEDSFDFEGMTLGRIRATEILAELSARLKEAGIAHARYGCGGCSLCPQCSYPDAPCRLPEEAISSIESCGVDVVTLARDCGIHYHNGANTVTYFIVLLTNAA